VNRWATFLVVAGVALIGTFAVGDALRGDGKEPTRNGGSQAPTTAVRRPVTLQDTLRQEAIAGFVTYSDPDCVLHSLLLPRMLDEVVRNDDGSPFRICRFSIGGGRYLNEAEIPSPDGTLVARCRAGRISVWQLESGIPERSYRGCPPAWRPDGRLTYPRGDRIMEENRVLLTASDLRRAARKHPNIAGLARGVRIFVHATSLAWLDEGHLAASLEIHVPYVEPQYLGVVFFGDDVVTVTTQFGNPFGRWIVSPAGTYAAAESGAIVALEGRETDPPQNLPDGRAAAFSPDEQWLAYVTGVSVYLIGTPRNSEPGRIIRLPVKAQDLSWEPVGRGTLVPGLRTG
jgi:hypothetical protein